MTKLIGIRYSGLPSVAEVLYFDQIAVSDMPKGRTLEETESLVAQSEELFAKGLGNFVDREEWFRVVRQEYPDGVIRRAEYLADAGILVDAATFLSSPQTQAAYAKQRQRQIDTGLELLRIIKEGEREPVIGGAKQVDSEKASLIGRIRSGINHLLVLPLRTAIGSNPELHPVSILSSIDTSGSESVRSVLEVTLRAFPCPHEDTTLQDLVEFRADENARLALRRLRRWVNKMASQSLQPSELQDELEGLLDSYTEHMRIHRLKHRPGLLRTVVSMPIDVIENLLRLKLRPAFEALFSIQAGRLALAEAELKAPGREVAYIEHVRNSFAG